MTYAAQRLRYVAERLWRGVGWGTRGGISLQRSSECSRQHSLKRRTVFGRRGTRVHSADSPQQPEAEGTWLLRISLSSPDADIFRSRTG